jgi:hypothetical protein
MNRILARSCLALGAALLAACGPEVKPGPEPLRPEQARALIQRLLPSQAPDRAGWAGDH